jgi:hypothetical protein
VTTKVCPACGAEYIPTATACADCKVALVLQAPEDDAPGDGFGAGDPDGAEALDDLEGSDDGEALAYDLADWSDDQRLALTDQLTAEGIPWGWDGDELLVELLDEARVEELVEGIDFPDALDADESDDGDDAAPEVMSTLYVAADRLRANPDHRESVMAVLDAAEAAHDLAVPFGIEPPTWRAILEQVDALADALGEADDPDEARDAAHNLRASLRPYV